MIITRTPLTTPTNIPPTHVAPTLVDVLLLTIGGGICIHVELSVHRAQDLDVVVRVPLVVMMTVDTVIVVIFELFISV